MVYRLNYVPGRYFEVPISTHPSRGPWPLMTFKNMCVRKVKPCKIDLLLEWSTTKLFSASLLCSIPIYMVSMICKYISEFWKKNIDMAQISTQITGIAFSELKAEKKQLITKIKVKCCFVKISISIDLSCRKISGPSRERRSGDGYFKTPSQDIL